MAPNLIAFAGYSRSGKDTAAKALYPLGYKKHAFGDIIKEDLNGLIKKHFGFSAFTEDNAQKEKIRRTLEAWGEDNYDAIFDEYFLTLPEKAVNTRLIRAKEAWEWKRRGGIIVAIIKKDLQPATEWEQDRLTELFNVGLVDRVIWNDGTPEELHTKVRQLVGE